MQQPLLFSCPSPAQYIAPDESLSEAFLQTKRTKNVFESSHSPYGKDLRSGMRLSSILQELGHLVLKKDVFWWFLV
jgi:hypothetical protein